MLQKGKFKHNVISVLSQKSFMLNYFFTICKFYIKQGVECRFLFPNKSCVDTGVVPDKGPNGKHIVDWHHLNGEILRVAPWMLEPKRPMGCQFINTHNVAVSEVFNGNTNTTISGPDTVYYATV